MLRPATPLTLLLFGAFALLLISVLSTPIIEAIPLASYGGISFGVFGYCHVKGCSKVEIGYNTANLGYTNSESASFNLSASTRTTLSTILILHPVTCLFTLVMFVLAGTAHLHSPSHSPRYLLGLFILSILTLLLSLLSFLIDVLLFVPHLAWGSYLVLAATILIAISGVISCAMRRTLVSRKARAKRIAENAEMNGENFYARQAKETAFDMPQVPVVNSATETDKLPAFATFESGTKAESGRTSDERVPLTSRTPSKRSPDGGRQGFNGPVDGFGGPPRMGQGGRGGINGGMSNGRYNGQPAADEYGNPLPTQGGYGPPGMRGRDLSQDRMQNPYPNGSFSGRGGPLGGYRGRGGPYYPGGRGGFNPNMRGGYGGPWPGRGGMMGPVGAEGMVVGAVIRGGRMTTPGYGQPMYRGPSPVGSNGGYGRSQPPVSNGPYGNEPGRFLAYNGGDDRDSLPRAESPPPLPGMDESGPVGQVVETDAATGGPSIAPRGFGNHPAGIRDSDSEVAGMVGLQQAKLGVSGTVVSDSSTYSNDETYEPRRKAWGEQNPAGRSSPLNQSANPSGASNHRRQNSGDNYYEDIDPRFAELALPPNPQTLPSSSNLPSSLTPGYSASGTGPGREPNNYLHPNSSNPNYVPNGLSLDGNNSYEDIHEGARSPAGSELSSHTSVSQRGVNPRWNPQMGPGGYGNAIPNRRPAPPASQRNDILLNSNPDFEIPGVRSVRMGGRGDPRMLGGVVARSAYDGGVGI